MFLNNMISQKELQLIQSEVMFSPKYAMEYFVTPTDIDYQNGQITRYFVQKVNDSRVIEVNQSNFNDVSTFLYIKVSLQWKITGTVNNIIKNNQVQTIGVTEFNTQQILDASKVIFQLSDKLINPLQFYKS